MGNRASLVTGIGTMMSDFITANPTLLIRHFRSRPTSVLSDWPMSYLDLRPTSVSYSNGLRDSIYTPSIVFVDQPGDNGEISDRLDALVDAFTDHLDSYAHLVAGTVWSQGEWTEESIPISNETSVPGVRWTFGPISFSNGRN